MANTLQDHRVSTVLDRMYTESKSQMSLLRERRGQFDRPMTTAERSEAMSEFYIPVTPEAGRLLYALVRATRPTTVVEFGMSFGISAVHLAAAVRDNGNGNGNGNGHADGHGQVITTELSEPKIAAAKKTFAETGLDDVITILEGDALSTLESLEGPVDFVLLDGWKDLYLPVIKLLEPRLPAGALIVADNTNAEDTQPYLDRVRNPDNGYVSFNFLVRDSDSMEISCRTGD
jgi:predicted O-methyltransferase YrrM